MKINNISNIFFQKRLVARANIKTNTSQEPVRIYHLDNEEDITDLSYASHRPLWEGSNFLKKNIINLFPIDYRKNKYYIMENSNGDIISYAKTRENSKECNLLYIETAPKLSIYNNDRKTKYIGETMLAFITKKAAQTGKIVFIPEVVNRDKTKEFYKKCRFNVDESDLTAVIRKPELDTFIQSNENHTGSKIELYG